MELKVGQVWQVEGLPTESELTIGKIEKFGDTIVVSVSLTNVPVPQVARAVHKGRTTITFSHVPFSEQALRASLVTFVRYGGDVDSEFWDGYNYWREAVAQDEAAAFHISVEKAVEVSFQTTSTGLLVE